MPEEACGGPEERTDMTAEELFEEVYTNFKLHFYRAVFHNFSTREATLTTVETFCMEVIYAMKNPTVNEFSSFIGISSPNAAYKINSLVKKGYLKKVQSVKDRREYFLQVTQKYKDYYNISANYVSEVMSRVKAVMTDEEWKQFYHVLTIIQREQMKDVPVYHEERHLEEMGLTEEAGDNAAAQVRKGSKE
jgi:DNA-binding MarR family transcriptional regulator